MCSCGVRLFSRSPHADRGTTPSPSSHTSPTRPEWAAMRAARFRRREISTQPWPRRNRPRGGGRRLEGPGRRGTRAPPWRPQVERASATAVAVTVAGGACHVRWRAASPGHAEDTAGPTCPPNRGGVMSTPVRSTKPCTQFAAKRHGVWGFVLRGVSRLADSGGAV